MRSDYHKPAAHPAQFYASVSTPRELSAILSKRLLINSPSDSFNKRGALHSVRDWFRVKEVAEFDDGINFWSVDSI